MRHASEVGTKAEQSMLAVQRVVLLLRTIQPFGTRWFGVRQLCQKTGFSLATMHRYLTALVIEDVLEYNEDSRKYRRKTIMTLL